MAPIAAGPGILARIKGRSPSRPARHGWHFNNDFVNQLLGGLITTYGLCGGMAYSSLDYYFNGIPIPTHRMADE